jgi:hypothetical protein
MTTVDDHVDMLDNPFFSIGAELAKSFGHRDGLQANAPTGGANE